MKETKEILDNILRMKKSEYEMLDPSATSFTSKPFDQKEPADANVLSGEAESELSEEGTREDMESYETFEVEKDPELDAKLKADDSVIYWDIMGKRMIREVK